MKRCRLTKSPSPSGMRPQKHNLRSHSPPVLLDELIVEILSWLPVKSLVRFSCVSKSWKSLISDPNFVKLHLHRSASNAHFAHHRLMSQSNFIDFRRSYAISCPIPSLLHNPSLALTEDKHGLDDKYWVVGSCNGLLCLAGLFVGEIWEEYWVRLWNPATRLRSEKSRCLCVNWRTNQYGSPSFGFGYDHVSDTYKVVAVLFDKEHSQRSAVKVFSPGNNCWRDINCFPVVLPTRANDGVYLSGTLNWLAVRNTSSGSRFAWETVTIDQLVIVSLDLGKETSRQLLLPRGLDEVPRVQPTLVVLRECLCVCHDYKRTHFVVWQMKEFGVDQSWTQLVKVSYEDLQTGCLEYRSTMLPLCLSENGDVLMVSKITESPAALYKWRDNGLKRYEIPSNRNWVHPRVYVESLVLPC